MPLKYSLIYISIIVSTAFKYGLENICLFHIICTTFSEFLGQVLSFTQLPLFCCYKELHLGLLLKAEVLKKKKLLLCGLVSHFHVCLALMCVDYEAPLKGISVVFRD